jgi:hypothetical protein
MAMTSVVMEELQEQLFAQAELNTREEAIVMWAHAKNEAV